MTDLIPLVDDEARMWVDVDAALILDEALDPRPIGADWAGDEDYDRGDQ